MLFAFCSVCLPFLETPVLCLITRNSNLEHCTSQASHSSQEPSLHSIRQWCCSRRGADELKRAGFTIEGQIGHIQIIQAMKALNKLIQCIPFANRT
jgi:hypothetical protein